MHTCIHNPSTALRWWNWLPFTAPCNARCNALYNAPCTAPCNAPCNAQVVDLAAWTLLHLWAGAKQTSDLVGPLLRMQAARTLCNALCNALCTVTTDLVGPLLRMQATLQPHSTGGCRLCCQTLPSLPWPSLHAALTARSPNHTHTPQTLTTHTLTTHTLTTHTLTTHTLTTDTLTTHTLTTCRRSARSSSSQSREPDPAKRARRSSESPSLQP